MKNSLVLGVILSLSICTCAQTFQWRGPKGDGHFNETSLLGAWPEGGPELVMSVEGLGKGYSSAIVVDGNIYVTGRKDSLDVMTAISVDGKIKWQVPYGKGWQKSFPESRGSATVDGNRVYAISGSGQLSCLNTIDGSRIWMVDVDKVYESEWHLFGVAETPLIVDDMVICQPGGKKTSVVALNKYTGELVWQSKSTGGARGYASASLYEYRDLRYILASTVKHLMALDPATGNIIWSFLHHTPERDRMDPGDGECMTNVPIYKGLEIFISKGYNYPAMMIQMDSTGKSVKEKWINQTLDNHHGGVLLIGDYIYGANFIHNTKGNWVCLEWNSGEVTYLQPWINKGSLIFADSLMYVYEERLGNIGLVKPNPEKFDLISSFQIKKGTGQHWAHLTICKGIFYVRHGDVLMAYDIRKK